MHSAMKLTPFAEPVAWYRVVPSEGNCFPFTDLFNSHFPCLQFNSRCEVVTLAWWPYQNRSSAQIYQHRAFGWRLIWQAIGNEHTPVQNTEGSRWSELPIQSSTFLTHRLFLKSFRQTNCSVNSFSTGQPLKCQPLVFFVWLFWAVVQLYSAKREVKLTDLMLQTSQILKAKIWIPHTNSACICT